MLAIRLSIDQNGSSIIDHRSSTQKEQKEHIPIGLLLSPAPGLARHAPAPNGPASPNGERLDRLHGDRGASRPRTFGTRTPGRSSTSSISATRASRTAGCNDSRSAAASLFASIAGVAGVMSLEMGATVACSATASETSSFSNCSSSGVKSDP